MYFLTSILLLLLSLFPTLISAAVYTVVKEYSGPNFFDGWAFYNHFDNSTNGNVNFVSEKEAVSSKLAFYDPSTSNVIMKVDNTSTVPFNQNRNSIRVTTTDAFTVGSVWVSDMLHVPFGCSVWPAWWSSAPDWPKGGEIDTFEAVNQVSMSHMAMHTEPGCTQVQPQQSSTLINTTDCSYLANGNEGCTVTFPTTDSYGPAFANAGGGVFVTEFAGSGINIWFFNRSSVPSVLTTNQSMIDTSTLGLPAGNWPSGGCPIGEFFQPQNLIFDITLCGDFAGAPQIFGETCSGVCYEDFVLGPPSNYDNAYFEVKYVRVFGLQNQPTLISGVGPSIKSSFRWLASVGAILALRLVSGL